MTDLDVALDNRDADACSGSASSAFHAADLTAVAVGPEVQGGNFEVSALFRADGDLGDIAGFQREGHGFDYRSVMGSSRLDRDVAQLLPDHVVQGIV